MLSIRTDLSKTHIHTQLATLIGKLDSWPALVLLQATDLLHRHLPLMWVWPNTCRSEPHWSSCRASSWQPTAFASSVTFRLKGRLGCGKKWLQQLQRTGCRQCQCVCTLLLCFRQPQPTGVLADSLGSSAVLQLAQAWAQREMAVANTQTGTYTEGSK